MTDYRLSKPQRNEVFAIVTNLGIDPTTFQWRDEKGVQRSRINRIVHTPTGAFLKIDFITGTTNSAYLLDHWPLVDRMHANRQWATLRACIANWLRAVKAESEAPDLWEVARQERSWLASSDSDFSANTQFTETERELLTHHLQTIEEYTIRTYELQASQADHVRQQLGYLTEAATRVGRFDWKNLAASTFINIVLTLGLDLEKSRQLLGFATQLLGPLLAGAAKLLP